MSKRLLILFCACLFLAAGCGLIYKQNIQQGNALEQEDLDQLEIGMTRNQVNFLLGTPAIKDPFNQSRWDYVSTFSRRGGDPVRRLVTLQFEDDRLVTMTGVDPTRDGGESVLTDSGLEKVEGAAPAVGVNTEDARDYEDLQILMPGEGLESWSVQVGSFSSRQAADQRMNLLREAGFQAQVYGQVIATTGFFIVRVTGLADHPAASAVLEQIESATGFRCFLVTPGG
jgi:outer membrane protein assembly factor BamE